MVSPSRRTGMMALLTVPGEAGSRTTYRVSPNVSTDSTTATYIATLHNDHTSIGGKMDKEIINK